MRVSMVSVGNELLDGRTTDRNSGVIGRLLAQYGLSLMRIDVVPDRPSEIVDAINRSPADIVVVSGGLGPTVDDLTRDAIAQWAGVELQEDPESLRAIRERFEKRGRVFSPNNARQALFPEGAHVIDNPHGTAPGFSVERVGKKVFSFPGVPHEFEALSVAVKEAIEQFVTPRIIRRWKFQGIGESALEEKLSGLDEFAVEVGFRAHFPTIELKLSGDEDEAMQAATTFVFERVGHWYVCDGDDTLAARVGSLLKERGWTITTAESCTAGGIAAALTDKAGSSWWFERGFVTYSNEAKAQMIGVHEATLESYGAVSAQVACQMALGSQKRADSQLALSVSGVAGPGGGSKEKPVGTVHFGLATPDGVYHLHVPFTVEGRDRIRSATVATSLALALWYLTDSLSERTGVTGPYSAQEVDTDLGIEGTI